MRIIKEDTAAIIGGAAVDGRSAAVLSPVAAPAWSITNLDTKEGIYDYGRNTTEIYGTRDHRFWGPYAKIREGLDYDFHSNYVKERQAIQDEIIQRIIERGSHHDDEDDGGLDGVKRASPRELGPDCRQGKETNQWVVFTAGPMGAGKSHTLRWLSKRGFFPLNEFVVADPDTIRNELPEIEGYIKADPQQAGSHTHREAGYILEILIRVCLSQGRKVLVQGSLRDSAWHAAYFNELKTMYPGLKIAIIHVTAAKETVLERARRRGETTKRVIPDEVLLASVEQTPKAVAELAPLVDYCVTIDNESEEPTLVTQGETWKHFSAVWRDCRPFPPQVIGDENSRSGGSSSGHI